MNKTTKIFFLGIAVALEGIISAMIGTSSSLEIFLFLSAACMCISPAFLIAGLARPIKKGRLGQRLQYCAMLLLAEGLLAGYLCQTKFGDITLYIAIGCFIIVPVLLLTAHFLPSRKGKAPEELTEEPAEAPIPAAAAEPGEPEAPAETEEPNPTPEAPAETDIPIPEEAPLPLTEETP